MHVRIEREARGWSTAELARRVTDAGCPISQSAIWRIENGEPRRKISVDELIAFSKVFSRQIEYLLKPAHPEFPNDLIRGQLIEWVERELEAWRADSDAGRAAMDLAMITRVYPGVMPHLDELLEELLEERHLTFLREKMSKLLNRFPQWVAKKELSGVLDSTVLVAYWRKVGLSKSAMVACAEDWNMDSVAESIKTGHVVARGGRRVPIDQIFMEEDGSVRIGPRIEQRIPRRDS